jgi:hypothetical protein
MSDLRELCQQFVDAVDQLTSHGDSVRGPGHRLILTVDVDHLEELAESARATLSEPVVGPADEAPEKEAPAWYNSDMASSWEAGRQDGWSDALARYGTNPTPIPVAERQRIVCTHPIACTCRIQLGAGNEDPLCDWASTPALPLPEVKS